MSESLKTLMLVIAALVLTAGGLYVYEKKDGLFKAGDTASTTTAGDITAEGTGEYTIELLPNAPVPPVLGAIAFSPDVSAEARAIISGNIATLRRAVEQDPSDLPSWSELGIHYKAAGDHQKARMVWEYMLALVPHDAVILYNLGYLHQYHLADKAKARSYYGKALKEAGSNTSLIKAIEENMRFL